MAIAPDIVKHVANLARLDLPEEEIALYTDQLGNILDLMKQLDRLDTDGIEPMSHAVDLLLPERADRAVNGDRHAAMFANAPQSEDGHFRVPKIIE